MPRKTIAVKVRVWLVTEATANRRGAAFPATRVATPEYYSAVIEDEEGSSEVVLLRTGRRSYVAGPEGVDQAPQHATPRGDLLCWASAECDRGGTHEWAGVNDEPLGGDTNNGVDEPAAPDTLTLEAPAPPAPRRASTAAAARPRASTAQSTPVDAIVHHEDARTNIPTEQLRDFVEDGEDTQLRYPRDPSLDPQLVWKGKDDLDGEDLAVWLRPIFIQEKIHPLALIEDLRRQSQDRAGAAQQLDFFADFNGIDSFEKKLEFYQHDQHWSNRMILGDSLMVMASLAEKEGLRGKVQTIYLDPPYGIKFGSNWQVSTRKRDVRDGRAEDATREPEMVRAFRDTWQLGIHSYLTYLRDRFVVARDLLTESGSIFVQIGDENVHLVRAVMDEVFGSENFVTTINLKKKANQKGDLLESITDYILFYAKEKQRIKFRPLFLDKLDDDDAEFSADLTGGGVFRTQIFPFSVDGQEFEPSSGNSWKTSFDGMRRLSRAERIRRSRNQIRYRRLMSDFGRSVLTNNWEDTGGAADRIYAVQTAVKVVQRCVLMTTDPGDLVLDPTCGSGTAAYVAEQWGRRWITVDTSRVALTLARTRLMSARYPHYLLADSVEGRRRQVELLGEHTVNFSTTPSEDIRQGFVYRRVPHIQLRDIANNEEIDVIWERWQQTLEPLRGQLNAALRESWEEWQLAREAGEDWTPAALEAHGRWWEARRARQREIDESIARNSESEVLYDQPYDDNKKVRVAGPFTVESLSPHRVLDPAEALPRSERAAQDAPEQPRWEAMVIDHLKTAGIQNTKRGERLRFTRLEAYAHPWLHAEGEFEQEGQTRRIAVSIGPQYGTVGADWVKTAAREAVKGLGFDVLAVCALAFDANASEAAEEFQPEVESTPRDGHAIAEAELRYGRLPVLLVRMNPDLAMGDDLLKKTGAANLFMVFGEPDIEIAPAEDAPGHLVVRIHGLDIYDPTTGDVRSSSTDDIACWFLDTAYDEASFFVRHAYFTGADEPYERLRRSLRADVDEEAWASLYRTESRPFPRPESGKIAVKVINHYGDEVLKVYEV